ncbi:phosphoribosylamine--glycine ligase [Bacillus horti]|uniref:Phosphoribosylamine--glycine ligase n=1 Tax=Caldalkalibacillus horti TaxID=77523 RepID=A0ABT9W2C3_9BACI|nr:phosphoribosylamine--glycine ligase [Bacillus horti]MDQ0167222.1 phosphoribosylamine--glycine ligase [Bacillus horti]
MKVLVIGQGGREHTICWKLKQSNKVSEVYCAPGNGGIGSIAEIVPIKESQVNELIQFVQEKQIDLTFVGPEQPLTEGIVDQFEKAGLKIYGPHQSAAVIEGSKSFAKELMKKYHIPTATYEVFTTENDAIRYLEQEQTKAPIVIKADGLAAGKGVVVAQTMEEAKQAVHDMMGEAKFGEAGYQVVIEEFLQGEELSLMAFVDGETVLPMVPAQDHKPVFDGDEGPNTGGMGAYSPVPQFGEKDVEQAVKTILLPTAKAMVAEGKPFRGILYAGLMMTAEGAKVIEFNARFGDPETQVILPRLETDLVEVIEASLDGTLHKLELEWSEDNVVTVVLASPGYPQDYPKGLEITGVEKAQEQENVFLFHAGTKLEKESLVTSGGRVINVTAKGSSLKETREKVYKAVDLIKFEGVHYRKDIAQKAMNFFGNLVQKAQEE